MHCAQTGCGQVREICSRQSRHIIMLQLASKVAILPLLSERARLLSSNGTSDDHEFCSNGIRGARWSQDWLVCCAKSCGTCGGPGCASRPGGRQACCAAGISRKLGEDRWCRKRPANAPCFIRNTMGYSAACARGIDGHRCLPCMRGAVSNGSECCASSCGSCSDDGGACMQRAGGGAACCPHVITAKAKLCKSSRHVGCRFNRFPVGTAAAHVRVAWGVYARTCREVDAVASACIGCDSPNTRSVSIVDEAESSSAAASSTATAAASICRGTTYSFRTYDLLPSRAGTAGGNAGAAPIWNFDKVRALLGKLLLLVPDAAWYVKLDTDAFLNVDRLRAILLFRINVRRPLEAHVTTGDPPPHKKKHNPHCHSASRSLICSRSSAVLPPSSRLLGPPPHSLHPQRPEAHIHARRSLRALPPRRKGSRIVRAGTHTRLPQQVPAGCAQREGERADAELVCGPPDRRARRPLHRRVPSPSEPSAAHRLRVKRARVHAHALWRSKRAGRARRAGQHRRRGGVAQGEDGRQTEVPLPHHRAPLQAPEFAPPHAQLQRGPWVRAA